MGEGIKILLTADIHLGGDSYPLPASVRTSTFKKITSLAREHDLLLIAGDLLEDPGVSSEIIELITNEFQAVRAGGTEIVLSPGGGEIHSNGVVSEVLQKLGCSVIFDNSVYSEPFVLKKKGQTVYVYGKPAPVSLEKLKEHRETEGDFHIGLYYLDFSLEKNRSLISGPSLDFFALGSMHSFRMFKVHDRIIGVYPGSPEATDLAEEGERYVVSMKVEGNDIQSIKRLSVNSVRLKNETIECSAYGEIDTLAEDLSNRASRREFLKLVLEGDRDFPLSGNILEKLKKSYYDILVEDNTLPTLSSYYEEFGEEESIRGEAFRILKERLENRGSDDELSPYEIRMIFKKLMENGINAAEEWLCDTSNA